MTTLTPSTWTTSQKRVTHDISNNAGFTVPLTRAKRLPSMHDNHDDAGRQELTAVQSPSLHLNDGPGVVKTQLKNADNYAYLIRIGVGGQFFDTILDTGSSDLWVASSECKDEDCKRLFKYTATSALKMSNKHFKLEYLTANVSGTVAFETVTFGQFEVSSQAFALVNETHNMGLTVARASGVLGLAFPYESAIPLSLGRTLLESVFANLEPPNRFFAFKLSSSDTGNTFSVGQLDPAISNRTSEILYSTVYSAPGAPYDYWKLQLHAITVNGNELPAAMSPSKVGDSRVPIAVLDTGTTLVLGPSKAVEAFWSAVGGAVIGEDGRWRMKCEHAVVVGFVLGNDTVRREFVMDPADVSWRATGRKGEEGWCVGGIQSNDGVFSGDWLLGDVFLRNVYVVHQSASSASPPLIGLVSTTDTSSAVSHFQSLRGNDTVPSPEINNGSLIRHSDSPSLQPWILLGLSGVLAFIGGVFTAAFVRVARDRMLLRRGTIRDRSRRDMGATKW